LHLHDGPATRARDARVARFPEDFGWIHAYDVQQALVAVQPSPI
jgi:salicylate hydroxylase